MYMKPVRQLNATANLAPLDDLEHNVIDALDSVRVDIATTVFSRR